MIANLQKIPSNCSFSIGYIWKEINLFSPYYEGKYHKLLENFTIKATYNLWNELNLAKENAEIMIL